MPRAKKAKPAKKPIARRTTHNIMESRGLVKRGVPLRTRKGKPSTVFRRQLKFVLVDKAPRKTFSYTKAGEAGRAIMLQENRARRKAGQPLRQLFEPEFVKKLRVVTVAGEKMYISPSGYLPYVARVRFGETLTQKQKTALAKRGRLLSTMPHLIGAGAGVLSLGQKYILIPKRPSTVGVHPGKFHWIAGLGDFYSAASGRKFEKPAETTKREAIEEIGGNISKNPSWFSVQKVAKELGAAGKNVQFLGQGLKPVNANKAPALIMLQDRNINMFEIQHAVNIKMNDPDKFIRKNFTKGHPLKTIRVGGGFSMKNSKASGKRVRVEGTLCKFRAKAAVEDKWEMAEAAIIPRTSVGIHRFIKAYRSQITQAARLGLLAYAAELRKIERKKNH